MRAVRSRVSAGISARRAFASAFACKKSLMDGMDLDRRAALARAAFGSPLMAPAESGADPTT